MTREREEAWIPVCRAALLAVERGVAVMLGGRQLAIFRMSGGQVFAVGNRDPYSGANVMSRGIVGTSGALTTVTSPMHKQVFDLRSGRALLDPDVCLGSYATRDVAGIIEIRLDGSPAGCPL
ncbi:MAG: nitrite reductase small subunit NirD [Candidatus Nanopelagicales bacterium]|nr:nitrite reductase small subunit NirD [Candidatus Nanopelagicales bacterium]MDZ4250702.1 nitrite reductase small subunit NirD [Candidatus Nanopelagicales bacterium]